MIMMMMTMMMMMSEMLVPYLDLLEAAFSVGIEKLMGTMMAALRWMSS